MVCVDLSGDYTSISRRWAQEARNLGKQLEAEGVLCQDPMRMVRAESIDSDSSENRQAVGGELHPLWKMQMNLLISCQVPLIPSSQFLFIYASSHGPLSSEITATEPCDEKV